MCTPLKTQLIALSVMSGIGVAMPAAAFVASEPFAVPYHAFARLAPAVDQQQLVQAAEPVDRTPVASLLNTPNPNGVRWSQQVRRSQPAVAALARSTGPARCYEHHSQTLAIGAVTVCDVERSRNHQPHRLFDAIVKSPVLAERTIESPTGLLR
jgi:hypothetical protein